MKYILILYLAWGAAPIVPEHHVVVAAEFDDLAACEAVIKDMKGGRGPRVEGKCFPKASVPAKP